MFKIRDWLLKIPEWLEFTLILFICFGLSIYNSIQSLNDGSAFSKVEFTNRRLIFTLIFELIISLICLSFLWVRGYKIQEKVQFKPTIEGSFLAVGLFFSTQIAYIVCFIIISLIVGRENLSVANYVNSSQILVVLAVSIINPLFEETFVVGYFFDKLQTQNIWLIIIASSFLRTSYHLYQGWIGIISILPLGLIFGLVYWKTRNLWSLYLAHAAMDFIGLWHH